MAGKPAPVGLIAALDIGTAKTTCVIARSTPQGGLRLLASATQASEGMKAGAVVDIDKASHRAGAVVEACEASARESVDRVLVNLASGQVQSGRHAVRMPLGNRAIGTADLNHLIAEARLAAEGEGRELIHFLPLGYAVDDARGIRDPRGLFGTELELDTLVVSARSAASRTLRTALASAHLDVQQLAASAYASGLAVLHDDEKELGVTVIDIGAGSTDIATFYDGELIFYDSVPLGGGHVTHDIAHGLSTPLAYAERLKTLHGSCLSASSDERDMVDVQPLGEHDEREVIQVSRALLVQIIHARFEEILEMVRQRLGASDAKRFAGGAAVLTGGSAQMHGLRELCAHMLDKRIRIGRPGHVSGLAELGEDPAAATAIGLTLFAQRQHTGTGFAAGSGATEISSMVSRMTGWMRRRP